MKQHLKKLKVSKKLQMSFTMVIAIFVVAIITAIVFLFKVGNSLTSFYNTPYQNRVAIMELRRNMQATCKDVLWATNTEDTQLTTERLKLAQEELDAMMDRLEFLRGNFTNKELFKNMEAAVSEVEDIAIEVMELAADNRNEEALVLYDGEFNTAMSKVVETTGAVVDFTENKAQNDYGAAQASERIALIVVSVLSVLSIALALYLVATLSKAIVDPITELQGAADNLSNGVLDFEIAYQSADELGSLADNFRVTSETLRSIILDLGRILKELADKNLDVRTECEERYIGAFQPLLMNVREAFVALSKTMANINEASKQVSLGSNQMAESAQGLAEGATEQAGAIEELQATIHQHEPADRQQRKRS